MTVTHYHIVMTCYDYGSTILDRAFFQHQKDMIRKLNASEGERMLNIRICRTANDYQGGMESLSDATPTVHSMHRKLLHLLSHPELFSEAMEWQSKVDRGLDPSKPDTASENEGGNGIKSSDNEFEEQSRNTASEEHKDEVITEDGTRNNDNEEDATTSSAASSKFKDQQRLIPPPSKYSPPTPKWSSPKPSPPPSSSASSASQASSSMPPRKSSASPSSAYGGWR